MTWQSDQGRVLTPMNQPDPDVAYLALRGSADCVGSAGRELNNLHLTPGRGKPVPGWRSIGANWMCLFPEWIQTCS
jgi:hypothetical protein